jgi:Protein of unknown function (DUF3137)
MSPINFSTLPDITDKLSPTEISDMNTLFMDPYIQAHLEQIEVSRKTRAKWKWGIYGLTTLVAFGFSWFLGQGDLVRGFLYTIGSWDHSYPITILVTMGTYGLCMSVLYAIFSSQIEIPLKSEVLARLCPLIYSKLEYSYDAKYSFDDLSFLTTKGFINSYDQIDRAEDSVYFSVERDNKIFVLNGYEFETSEIRWSGKSRKRITTNHDYLMKVQFPHARIPLQSDLYITKDYGDIDLWGTFTVFSIGGFVISLFFSWIFIVMFGFNSDPFNIIPIVGSLLIATWVCWLIHHFLDDPYPHKNEVKLENIEFEKLFDVECEDQITSRMILTPAFMDRLVSFVQKTGNQYQFLFQQNVMYVKRTINQNYLEAGTERDITKNLKGFVQFYIDMREICLFANDMNLLYLSKTDTQVSIDPVDTSVTPIPSITNRSQQDWLAEMITTRLMPAIDKNPLV